MKTIAFLQNMWVRDPERVKRMIAESEHAERLRRMLIARSLFAGCLTGRRLRNELGALCDTIIWEEASLAILGDPKIVPKADFDHMMKAFALEQPQLVVTFGNVARDAWDWCRKYVKPAPTWIHSPHPAARGVQIQAIFRQQMSFVKAAMQ